MSEIEWREPPTSKVGQGHSHKGRWQRALAVVRERPGEWAYVGVGHTPTSSFIKAGRVGGGSPGEFDAVARQRDDGKCDIYARYVGGES